ncbi:MAG: hypothetical protein LUC30_10290 [Clostridiales bacterium]|nr:hypothetical protein [Clostridiales bacterium]
MAMDMTEYNQWQLETMIVGMEACGKQIARDAKKMMTIFGMESGLQILIAAKPDELVSMRVIADGMPNEEFWPV